MTVTSLFSVILNQYHFRSRWRQKKRKLGAIIAKDRSKPNTYANHRLFQILEIGRRTQPKYGVSPLAEREYFIPTEDGLDFAESIAAGLGMEFDRNETADFSFNLVQRYFLDITRTLGDEAAGVTLDCYAMRDFSADTALIKGRAATRFDDQWNHLLFIAYLLIVIRSCYSFEPTEEKELAQLFLACANMAIDPHTDQNLHAPLKMWMADYEDALPVANLLTQSTLAFALCHEIAHKALGHLQYQATADREREADRLAFQYLLRVSAQFEAMEYLKVPPNFVGASVLGFRFLEVLPQLTDCVVDTSNYPPLSERIATLRGALEREGDPKAVDLLGRFELGFEDILNFIASEPCPA